jgi:DNA-binding transcriptional LysR family regulator
VSPQGARFLDKARQLLDQAETMLRVGLYEAAGAGLHI